MSSENLDHLKVAFSTIGCRSNFADTMDLQTAALEYGITCLDFNEHADVYVLNTCTVTNGADVQARRTVKNLRFKYPTARIVVTGCMAEVGFKDCPEACLADAIIGTSRKSEVLAAILGKNIPAPGNDLVSLGSNFKEDLAPLSKSTPAPGTAAQGLAPRARFHLRIQDGCDNLCTFCIVPSARGNSRAKPTAQVVEEIKTLGKIGYDEVVLTGTHLGGFGAEREESLLGLLRAMKKAKVSPRIRISSLDPNDVSAGLIDFIASSNLVCEHLHVCFQSFSNKMLKLMNRRYTMTEAIEAVSYAAAKIKGLCLGADLICGFPQETDDILNEQLTAFKELPLSYLHVFPYSERQGTPATRLSGSIALNKRRERAQTWRALSVERRSDYLKSKLNTEMEIIVERITPDGHILGTSREYASCAVSPAASAKNIKIGRVLKVQAKEIGANKESLICLQQT
ncbi:MAG: MiaB/RimO family radical SAM methylthiotransferase [Deltaproteobacteria bacterium]|nr:MiaB/RimO family radical SAM methylthiotransferase [Deltaproteobacteria bacterium]